MTAPTGHTLPQNGPLRGLRVVELGALGPVPFAAMLMAGMGADVVRVDRPDEPPPMVPLEHDLVRRDRRSVLLDLRSESGRESLLSLAEEADVLLEGSRPGVVERLGVGPETCRELNPRLVYGRMTGWGQDGPLSPRAGHDINYLAVSGALHAIGERGGAPVIPLNLVGDFGGGATYLVSGILAALWSRDRTGEGQVVDCSILDGVLSLMTPFHGMIAAGVWSEQRGTNLLDSGAPWYAVYETSDGGHVAIGAIEGKFFAELVGALGLDFGERDRRDRSRWPALREALASAFKTRTRDQWAEMFAESDACVTPVLSPLEARDHPQIAVRQGFVVSGGVTQPVTAPRFDRFPLNSEFTMPVVGDVEVDDVLSGWRQGGDRR